MHVRRLGRSVALSADGNTALVGGPSALEGLGAAWVFTRSGTVWSQQGGLLTGGEEGGAGHLGRSAALSADGSTALLGGPADAGDLGAAWAFTRSGKTWSQLGAKLTAGEETGAGQFGSGIALSADGRTALIGGRRDAGGRGSAWEFNWSGTEWAQRPATLHALDGDRKSWFGASVALSASGRTALLGGPHDSSRTGAAWIFQDGPVTPVVSSVEPSTGSSTGGTHVTIRGTGFVSGATVTIGSQAGAVEVLSEEEIRATTAATAPGSDEVIVSDGGGSSSGGLTFTYVKPPPHEEPHEEPQEEPHTEEPHKEPPHEEPKGSGGPIGSVAEGATTSVLSTTTAQLPAPVLARTGNLALASGAVSVRLPGSKTWVPLIGIRQIPFGTIVDAAHGSVTLTTMGPKGKLQTIVFSAGEFRLTQSRNGQVIATLLGGNFSVCPTAKERAHIAAATIAASRRHVVRKLWASGHGSYSTRGNYATGAVLGTRWLTEDRCDGTLIYVATDRVLVRSLVNHRHRVVKAHHSYLAKAP